MIAPLGGHAPLELGERGFLKKGRLPDQAGNPRRVIIMGRG